MELLEALLGLALTGASCICCVLAAVVVMAVLWKAIQGDEDADGTTVTPDAPRGLVQAVGFFREMKQGRDTDPSIQDAISRGTDAPRLVAYLKAGEMIQMVMGPVEDPVNPDRGFIASMHIVSDGVYCWPEALAYLVENYAVELPAVFLAHIEANDWTMPEAIDVDVDIDRG
jgi:hypothetical protein